MDDPHFWRKKWGEVKLRCNGDRIELAELMLFRSKFETALSRVPDWTELEVIDALMKSLPSYWVQEIVKQEAKRAKYVGTVRWNGGTQLGEAKIRAIVEKVVGRITNIVAQKGAYLLDMSKEQAEKMAQIGTVKVGTELYTLEQVRKRMSPADMFDYLQSELRTREESQIIAGQAEKQKLPARYAQAVDHQKI